MRAHSCSVRTLTGSLLFNRGLRNDQCFFALEMKIEAPSEWMRFFIGFGVDVLLMR